MNKFINSVHTRPLDDLKAISNSSVIYMYIKLFLGCASLMNNTIIKSCINRALYKSNYCVEHKIAFCRHTHGLYLTNSIKQAILSVW